MKQANKAKITQGVILVNKQRYHDLRQVMRMGHLAFVISYSLYEMTISISPRGDVEIVRNLALNECKDRRVLIDYGMIEHAVMQAN